MRAWEDMVFAVLRSCIGKQAEGHKVSPISSRKVEKALSCLACAGLLLASIRDLQYAADNSLLRSLCAAVLGRYASDSPL